MNLEGKGNFDSIGLEELLRDHVRLAERVVSKVRVLPLFRRYLSSGYYPFYREDAAHYGRKLVQVVNQVLERDLPMVEDITPNTIRKARRMLTILAASTPQTPNITELSRNLGMDRKQGIKILYLLQRAGLTGLLAEDAEALKHLGAPSKIFCDNGNLMQALVARPDTGTMREAFFNNQLSVAHVTTYPKRGDFLVDGKYLFEIGGAKKTFAQVKKTSVLLTSRKGI